VFEHHAWAFVKGGEIVRYFVARDGELIHDFGKATPAEVALGLDKTCYGRENDDDYNWNEPKYLAEEDVIALSEKCTAPHWNCEGKPKSETLGGGLKRYA
jgi:hypothetical protein